MSFLLPNRPVREGYTKISTGEDDIEKPAFSKWKYLPVNLLLAIFLQIDNDRQGHHAPWLYTKTVLQPTLFAASLVNKCWSEVAKDVLYKDVLLTTQRALSSFSSSLRTGKGERLRPFVQSVFFCRAYSANGEEWLEFNNNPSRSELDSIYDMCRNLRSGTVDMRVSLPCHVLYRLFGIHCRRVERQLANFYNMRLTRLDIRPAKNTLHLIFARHLLFPYLEHLVIRNYESDGKAGEGEEGREGKELEWPGMTNLKSLSFFMCGFRDKYLSLPESRCLRALEIIGGYFYTDTLWEEIVAIGGSLELLTFTPFYSPSLPYNDELAALPSLAVLRICPAYLVDSRTPNSKEFESSRKFLSLPPRLTHLVTIDIPCANSNPAVYLVQDQVMRLVNLKKNREAFLHLESVRINGRPVEHERRRQQQLQEQAAKAGVEFSLVDTGLAHHKKLCKLFKAMAPPELL